jgi:hypothetical protein
MAHRVSELISDIDIQRKTQPAQDPLVRDLCALATWCHAIGHAEKRDVAITLAADLLGEDPVLIPES